MFEFFWKDEGNRVQINKCDVFLHLNIVWLDTENISMNNNNHIYISVCDARSSQTHWWCICSLVLYTGYATYYIRNHICHSGIWAREFPIFCSMMTNTRRILRSAQQNQNPKNTLSWMLLLFLWWISNTQKETLCFCSCSKTKKNEPKSDEQHKRKNAQLERDECI